MNKILLIACTLAVAYSLVQPSAPVWPDTWQAEFHEEMTKGTTIAHTTGTFYYDWNKKLNRVDRASGQWDRFCGTVKFADTPCSHIIVEDWRYLYFPEENFCCACCPVSKGCGLTIPTWLKDAVYEGETVKDGYSVSEWSLKGLQQNYYWEVPDSRIPYEIFQSPNDRTTFDPQTFKSSITNPQIFDLPKICDPNQKCPKISFCGSFQ